MVAPVKAPSVSVAVPSVRDPPVTAPEAVTVPVTVCAPLASVPVVVIFSLPKLIAPLESVIEPVSYTHLTLPTIDRE